MEQRSTKSYSYSKLSDHCYKSRQDATIPTPLQLSYPETSGSGALGSLETEIYHDILQRVWFVIGTYNILLLDYTLGGLDGETEQNVFSHLIGSSELMRRLKTTIILVSSSCKLFTVLWGILFVLAAVITELAQTPMCRG